MQQIVSWNMKVETLISVAVRVCLFSPHNPIMPMLAAFATPISLQE
jgi:hypothetical protein